jgi:hypothetical protein
MRSSCAATSAETRRRFPPPWSIEDIGTGSAFVVKDSAGQKLLYVYYEKEPGRRSAAKMLTKDKARRIAANHDFISSGTQRGENISENVPNQKNNYSNSREKWSNHWHVRFIVVAAL